MSSTRREEIDWWSADLEGEMEKLEVEGGFSGAEGRSMDPKRKVGHWSARFKTTKKREAGKQDGGGRGHSSNAACEQ